MSILIAKKEKPLKEVKIRKWKIEIFKNRLELFDDGSRKRFILWRDRPYVSRLPKYLLFELLKREILRVIYVSMPISEK